MSLATSIIKKLDKVLARLDITDRVVYKRINSVTGGDSLIGRYGNVANQDTLLVPQPAVSSFSKDYTLVVADTALTPNGQYVAVVSSSALTRREIENPNLSVIFKDSAGKEEILYIEAFTPLVVNGTDLGFNVILGSKHR